MHAGIEIVVVDGGHGLRLRPFTKALPKSMLPYEEGTVLDSIISTYAFIGTALIVISGYSAGIISAYLSNRAMNMPWMVLHEKTPKGSVGCLADLVNICFSDILVVNFCDSIVQFDVQAAVNEFISRGAAMMVLGEKRTVSSDFGLMEVDGLGRVTFFQEKRVESIIKNCGVFLIRNDVLGTIKEHDIKDMESLIRHIDAAGEVVTAFLIEEGQRINTGDWSSYAAATDHCPPR